MIPSNTICVSQEGPANALALNKDCSQVVIAGRNVFKVFSIGENEFSEVCNLRVGKNLNLNFSSIDVAWSTIEENTLATAATNGAVVVWNLGRSGRSKQEHVFSDHKRTVNKVSFHLTEPALLISGSQDGMMKCFDLRMKEVARTFISNTESIRDVQFSPHQNNTFAAVSENGNVQVWDVRRHERCLLQFTAHSGPVFACDWHPEMPWLATASRDKTIKVWDIYGKPNLEHTIYTIASVGHVKWRPQKKHQVASCALVLDCAVHVWDVRRPHVPLATFAEHRDVTTAIAWLAEPHSFLSTSRDCSLYRHRFSEAAHPVLWANPHGVCVSARGEIAHAAPERPLPALPAAPAHPDRHVPGLGRKQPTAGSLSPTAQAALERAFPGGASSTLSRFTAGAGAGAGAEGALVECARRYRVRGAGAGVLAAHNARVARAAGRALVAHVWGVVRAHVAARAAPGRAPAPPPDLPRPDPPPLPPYTHTYPARSVPTACTWGRGARARGRRPTCRAPTRRRCRPTRTPTPPGLYLQHARGGVVRAHVAAARPAAPRPAAAAALHAHLPRQVCTYSMHVGAWCARTWPPPDLPRPDPPPLPPYTHTYPASAVEEETLEEVEDWAETQFHNSGVLGKPTLSIYIPPPKQAKIIRADAEAAGWVSAASAHYVDTEAADWTLPEEAFPLRSAPPPPHAPHLLRHDDKDLHASQRGGGAGGTSPGGSSSPGSGSSGSACTAPPNLDHSGYTNLHLEEGEAGAGEGGLAVRVGGCARAQLDVAPLLAAALRLHANLGDVQTAAVVMLVLQDYRSDLFPYIEESLQEHWLLGYIELLQRNKLWNVATEVVRCAWLNSVWVMSQQSTSVAVCCGRCGRRTRPHAACDSCHPHLRHLPDLCAVCHQVVRGLYAWCQGCSHGGHLQHMRAWMEKHPLCPAGCGHHCQLA